jgi:hypothetical protein
MFALANAPIGMRVMVAGYEGGYNDLTGIEVERIALNSNSCIYFGDHERADLVGDGFEVTSALVLTGGRQQKDSNPISQQQQKLPPPPDFMLKGELPPENL